MRWLCGVPQHRGPHLEISGARALPSGDANTIRRHYRLLRQHGLRPSMARMVLSTTFNIGGLAEARL